ncbi:DUF3016 domain-containing protein [Azoarcus olearius]|uniref:Conserved hypothetical secreted protein n=1 Tax=Azoarcus sp. (strain BH72) TaxID=418699 RepID=A1K5U8_AZOSB|nr:DUF3016 domain-containing protein [Azoarcus olearius]CAL94203.1 conserved hypothetical secreted protein [Azoarcus olearius]
MRPYRLIPLALAALAALGTSASQAEVSVRFVDPEQFTDIGPPGKDRQHNLQALERHLRTEAERCLPPGHNLDVQVLDVDLAGREEWWHHASADLRVMRETTWPRINLRYVWRDETGATRGQASERLTDMTYLNRAAMIRGPRSELGYERAMLADWVEHRLCRATPSR